MNKHIYKGALLFFACIFICSAAFAQKAIADTGNRQNAYNNAVNVYNKALGSQSPIFAGVEYNFYDPHIKGTAYFLDANNFTEGSILYDGTVYTRMHMVYDLNTDQVAVLLPNQVSRFAVIKERVKSFDFMNNHFINIDADSLKSDVITKSGYYDQLYNGKIEILAKYSKSIQTTTDVINGLENYFNPATDFYIKKNNVYKSFGGQSSLLNVLKDRKKELKRYIKENKIRYRDNPEAAMIKIATRYDQLTN